MRGVDIICVSYRTPDDLDGFVHSLWKTDPNTSYDLTLVNVDPSDRDRKMGDILASKSKGLHITHPTNVGYGYACNHAAMGGERDIIAFFNADTRLHAGTLDECNAALVGNRSWGVLGPRQLDNVKRVTHGGIFGTLSEPQHRGWLVRDNDEFGDVREAVSVSGSAYFIKREVWEELTECPRAPRALGAFLETPHYYDETWCSYHAQAHGHKVIYYGRSTMTHRWHGASPVGGWAEKQMPASRAQFRAACDNHGIDHD